MELKIKIENRIIELQELTEVQEIADIKELKDKSRIKDALTEIKRLEHMQPTGTLLFLDDLRNHKIITDEIISNYKKLRLIIADEISTSISIVEEQMAAQAVLNNIITTKLAEIRRNVVKVQADSWRAAAGEILEDKVASKLVKRLLTLSYEELKAKAELKRLHKTFTGCLADAGEEASPLKKNIVTTSSTKRHLVDRVTMAIIEHEKEQANANLRKAQKECALYFQRKAMSEKESSTTQAGRGEVCSVLFKIV